MSAKDSFFQKIEDNASKKKAADDAFKQEVSAFQRETYVLLTEIKGWFDGTPVQATTSTTQITESNQSIEVTTLTLHNGDKTLSIIPDGFYFYGVTGSLAVAIENPNSSPRTYNFSIHWKDTISEITGWVIVYGKSTNSPAKRIEFNEENFFNMISSFA